MSTPEYAPNRLLWMVWLLALIAGLTSLACTPPHPDREHLDSPPPLGTKLGAYYCLQTPELFEQGYLREKLTPPQQPLLGRYSHWNLEVSEQHISWASEYGVDFFVLEYLPGRSPNDARFELFLQAKNIEDIQFCIFYKGAEGTPLASELDDIVERFMGHPQYLKVHGRPVLVLSLDSSFSNQDLERWKETAKRAGHDIYVVLDAVDWDKGSVATGFTNFSSELETAGIDAVTGYSLFDRSKPKVEGYAEATKLQTRLRFAMEGARRSDKRLTVLPVALPGYNRRGYQIDSVAPVVARRISKGRKSYGLLYYMLRYNALPFLDRTTPLVFIRSWNEWDSDTAIEPLSLADATSRDQSGQELLTKGYSYEGFSMRHLEEIQELTVAAAGTVNSESGDPLAGALISAWKDRERVAQVKTDSTGRFRFPSWLLTPGLYQVGPSRPQSVTLNISKGKAQTGLSFVSSGTQPAPKPALLDLRPKLPVLRRGLDEYVKLFPSEEYALVALGADQMYARKGTPDPISPDFEIQAKRLLRPGDTVVEEGAFGGRLSLTLARAVGPTGLVYAVEHLRAPYRRLVHNLRRNNITNTVPLHYGLGEIPGVRESGPSTLVEERTLDSLHIPKMDLLCIRDGAAVAPTLRGAIRTLKTTRAVVLFQTRNTTERDIARGLLASFGYRTEQLGTNLFCAKSLGEGPDRVLLDVGSRRAQSALGEGFSVAEFDGAKTDYAWSLGAKSELTLKLSALSERPYILGIRARGLPELAPLQAEVFLNDSPVGSLTLVPGWTEQELALPGGILKEGVNRIQFRYSNFATPMGNTDQRELAMALDVVWLAPSLP